MGLRSMVQEGAAFLTSRLPGRTWWWEVDLGTLHMGYASRCVLGQIFGDYWDGLKQLGISDATATSMGFNYDDGTAEGLNAAWTRLIERLRRENAKPEAPTPSDEGLITVSVTEQMMRDVDRAVMVPGYDPIVLPEGAEITGLVVDTESLELTILIVKSSEV